MQFAMRNVVMVRCEFITGVISSGKEMEAAGSLNTLAYIYQTTHSHRSQKTTVITFTAM